MTDGCGSEMAPCHEVVDDDDGLTQRAVGSAEAASLDDRNTQRGEVAGRRDVHVCLRPFQQPGAAGLDGEHLARAAADRQHRDPAGGLGSGQLACRFEGGPVKHDSPDDIALDCARHPDERNRHAAPVPSEIALEADRQRSSHEPARDQQHGRERDLCDDNGGAKASPLRSAIAPASPRSTSTSTACMAWRAGPMAKSAAATHDMAMTVAISEASRRVSSIVASSGVKSAGSTPAVHLASSRPSAAPPSEIARLSTTT